MFYSFSAGIDFRRQNLTYKAGSGAVRVDTRKRQDVEQYWFDPYSTDVDYSRQSVFLLANV